MTNSLHKMPHACIAPYGVRHQHAIDKQGITIPKLGAAHDQSFKLFSGSSVNSRIQIETLTKLIYGGSLRQIIQYVHILRFHCPRTPILIRKFEFSDAYKLMTMWVHTSAASCTCHNNIAYISLRLTFGGSLCPTLWCSMLEIITGLANNILASTDWDLSKKHSPHRAQIIEPDILADDIPFAQALSADVAVIPLKHGKVDCYIDNLNPIILHSGDNAV